MNRRQVNKAAYARVAGMAEDAFSQADAEYLERLYGKDAAKVATAIWQLIGWLQDRAKE